MKLWHVVKESHVAGGKDYSSCSFVEVIYSSSYNECRKKAKELYVENSYDDINPKYTYPMSDIEFTTTHPFHDNFPDVREPIRTWHLYGSEYACDAAWFRTHILSSNDLMELEMHMSYESTGGQYRDMVIVHTDELEEDDIEEVMS